MAKLKTPQSITTESSTVVSESWCRKCAKMLPISHFYEAVDCGLVDTTGFLSLCRKCIQDLYDKFYDETQSIEKAIHRLCIILNVKYTNEAVDATKAHINSLIESGKQSNIVFGLYKAKIVATNKSMDKSIVQYEGYEDVGAIYLDKKIEIPEIPIPQDVINFWGKDVARKDIEFLETQYANFKQTHKAEAYAEIVLLKEVCYTMLNIKNLRAAGDDTADAIKELQSLMKNLAISPNIANTASTNKGNETFGLWIQDIEREEPAQWLKTDPRGDMYRDVGNVEEYFQKYIVRPLKNFILGSKDFNVNEENIDDEDGAIDPKEFENFKYVDDGEE